LPAQPITGTQRAWEYGSVCPQFTRLRGLQGEEDCLFLNIATPTRIRSRLPVLFRIHGGGLQFGDGQSDLLGPELIVQEDVIVVAINYRLNVLGFLSTGDRHSPGNYGLKDIILALQWVRNNIENFGGNPFDVTITGVSGGAAAVHALVVSQASHGFFLKAIISSGSLFSSWAFQRQPLNRAENLARALGLFYRNNEELVAQLRQVSIRRLLNAVDESGYVLFSPLDFIVSEDPEDSTELRIFNAPFETMIRQGNFNTVPLLTGHTSDESLVLMNLVRRDPTILERFNANPNLLILPEWNVVPNSPQAQEIITAFRNLYFNGSSVITAEHALQFSYYSSD
jgi:carboxylesterase type B